MRSRWRLATLLVSWTNLVAASGLSVTPNPFSPMVIAQSEGATQPGTVIRYSASAPDSLNFLVTLQVLNQKGHLIRTLAQQQSVPGGEHFMLWDGRDNDGNLVRNGRYILVMLLQQVGQDPIQQYRVPVVVFK